ncbi:MAG: ABC transporter ATP-binding protein [candidate division WOR-3 bacterium]|nr:MAG: ABC transporter ATP-binding protein [candidate division WOR-3 bacterium]
MPESELIRTERITKVYRTGAVEVGALCGVSLEIREGEYVGLMGPSGSGKSTLMHLLGCLDTPTGGRYWLGGRDVTTLDDIELARLRNREIGFVFQNFNLLPRLSAGANVQLPMVYAGIKPRDRPRRARELLEMVGLGGRVHHRSNELSGGEMQRVALARALANEPSIILADEPTGNLDTRTSEEIMSLFDRLADQGNTIIVVTHDPEVSAHVRRVIRLRDGQVESQTAGSPAAGDGKGCREGAA